MDISRIITVVTTFFSLPKEDKEMEIEAPQESIHKLLQAMYREKKRINYLHGNIKCLNNGLPLIDGLRQGLANFWRLRAAFTILRLSAGRKFQLRRLYLVSNIKFDYVMICLLII